MNNSTIPLVALAAAAAAFLALALTSGCKRLQAPDLKTVQYSFSSAPASREQLACVDQCVQTGRSVGDCRNRCAKPVPASPYEAARPLEDRAGKRIQPQVPVQSRPQVTTEPADCYMTCVRRCTENGSTLTDCQSTCAQMCPETR